MPYEIAGYPVAGFGAFATALSEGLDSGVSMAKNAAETRQLILKNRLAKEQAETAAALGDTRTVTTPEGKQIKIITAPDSGVTTTTAPAIQPNIPGAPGTTGSGGSGGGTGGWGPHAQPIIDYFTKAGYTPAAIQAIMGSGLAEGGFKENWAPSGIKDEHSFGHWQFNARGELPDYLEWAKNNNISDPKDSVAQARYVDYRMNQINPGFKTMTDPKAAIDSFTTGFERPKIQTPGARYPQLAAAQGYMAGIAPAQTAAAPSPDTDTTTTTAATPSPAATTLGPPVARAGDFPAAGGPGALAATPAPAPAPSPDTATAAMEPTQQATPLAPTAALTPTPTTGEFNTPWGSPGGPQRGTVTSPNQPVGNPYAPRRSVPRSLAPAPQQYLPTSLQPAPVPTPDVHAALLQRPQAPPPQPSVLAQLAPLYPPHPLAQQMALMPVNSGLFNQQA